MPGCRLCSSNKLHHIYIALSCAFKLTFTIYCSCIYYLSSTQVFNPLLLITIHFETYICLEMHGSSREGKGLMYRCIKIINVPQRKPRVLLSQPHTHCASGIARAIYSLIQYILYRSYLTEVRNTKLTRYNGCSFHETKYPLVSPFWEQTPSMKQAGCTFVDQIHTFWNLDLSPVYFSRMAHSTYRKVWAVQ